MVIRSCIFDLGGTLVDRYSLTTILSLKNAFQKNGIILNNKLIFKDMGIKKQDHITIILNDEHISWSWRHIHGRHPDINDSHRLFEEYNSIQKVRCTELMDIIPETKKTIDLLRDKGIQLGVTTGFNYHTMRLIKEKLDKNNIILDNYISSTCLDLPARPNPSMIIENMYRFDINDPKQVIKIDDTVVGIEEGKNAGCWTVGVSRWSINMKLPSIDDAYGLSDFYLEDKKKKCRAQLVQSGADYVIDTLDELPYIINRINEMDLS